METVEPNLIPRLQQSAIAHKLWKSVFLKQEAAAGKPQAVRYKPYDLRSLEDRITIAIAKKWDFKPDTLIEKKGQVMVNIVAVPYDFLPEQVRAGIKKSLSVASVGIKARYNMLVEKRVKDESYLTLDTKKDILTQIYNEIARVKTLLVKQQSGQKLSFKEKLLLRKSWVCQSAADIHVSWVEDNSQREELKKAYDSLDPFEKEKDVVFLEAVALEKIYGLSH